jgi:putative flippase GtrA
MQNVVLSVGSWIAGVIFAYFTNRKYVFISNEPMGKEACKFALCRVSTCVMDVIMMQILTAVRMDLMSATFLSTVVVTICNYLLSKVFVFARKVSAKESGNL